MATVRLSFSPAPAHVRTARLVAVAVARRAGVADEFLEEIRLATGEACSRAVALHRSHGVADLIEVALRDEERFTVQVIDRASNGSALVGSPSDPGMFLVEPVVPLTVSPDSLTEEDVAERMGLALLAGLVDDIAVAPAADGGGTEVRMSWPLNRPGRAPEGQRRT
jgi:anti-sigma regulatory factor (Ser/Thr protein kinase)